MWEAGAQWSGVVGNQMRFCRMEVKPILSSSFFPVRSHFTQCCLYQEISLLNSFQWTWKKNIFFRYHELKHNNKVVIKILVGRKFLCELSVGLELLNTATYFLCSDTTTPLPPLIHSKMFLPVIDQCFKQWKTGSMKCRRKAGPLIICIFKCWNLWVI